MLFALVVGVLYFRRLRSRLVDRVVIFVLGLLAIIMVAQPEWATQVANFVGVGRGADLLTYVGISGLAFLWLRMYVRQRELEERLTELARHLALKRAEPPKRKAARRKKSAKP
ncbi:MAG: DUF2304 family protein [Anaerolineales bacterium]|nr:DUF2304 family protein [Anaerolineales bacterium]